jgi:aspartyl-tRNA(Asn)/glutamyl-tRNA(Gln) amidotransferase subunit B
MTWETVIGLEVHVQLATVSKLFCGCPAAFGNAPNTNVCPVCLGLPGALPVPNEAALRLATRAALALDCTVHRRSVFARKNYFYPDLPKGYQITQFDQPLATNGRVRCESPGRGPITVPVTRLHVEEDAGKSIHDRVPHGTAIDLNRAGVPLAEIVTGPDLQSPAEARAFLTALKQVLIYTGVSECNMEQGSLRVDANISLRRTGEPLGTKTEVKNLNSFANVERALEAAADRQRGILETGGAVDQVTLLFNAATGTVTPMRSKETSHDYRYFPDPDLPPVILPADWIDRERAAIPELPDAKRERLASQYVLSGYDARVLAADRKIADYFEAVVLTGAPPKEAANWVMGEILSRFNDAGGMPVPADRLGALIALVQRGVVSRSAGKDILDAIAGSDETPAAAADRLGLGQVRDDSALEAWVDQVMTAAPDEVKRCRNGETKLIGFLVGQVMKLSRGKADPKAIGRLIERKIA